MENQEFYKYLKESKKTDKLTKRKYIRTKCKNCLEVIEFDARVEKKHKGFCKKCKNQARDGYSLTKEDIVYECNGHKIRGAISNCRLCGKARVIPLNAIKKRSGYCKSCARIGSYKDKTLEEIQEHIKKNIKINKKGCWIWQKYKDNYGYGSVTVNKKICKTHRLSYTVFVNPIPEGILVRHKCHVRDCCNPRHLELGTHQENMNDMVRAGRSHKPTIK